MQTNSRVEETGANAEASPEIVVHEHWREAERAHRERAEAISAERRRRAERGERHPIDDFLWDYYMLKPRDLVRWYPGAGHALADDGDLGWRARARWHVIEERQERRTVTVDPAAFYSDRTREVNGIHTLLTAISRRTPKFGCFGWHEWAMVYRRRDNRHALPLRLGQAGTDAALEEARLVCGHYDAHRFFTPDAAARALVRPTRATQVDLDQPGCLHVGMDLVRWALKLGPACPGDLLLDCVELSREIRVLDMAASPYDCTSLGVPPVRIETPHGRAEYVARQRAFSERAAPLRTRLRGVVAYIRAAAAHRGLPAVPESSDIR